MEKKQLIKDGKMRVFDGPVVNQLGETIVLKGETLDDGALLGIDFYIKGVDGKLPKK